MLQYIFIWLAQKLYPNGRAFRMPTPITDVGIYTDEDGNIYTDEDGIDNYITEESTVSGGILYRLHRVIAAIFAQAWTDAGQILNDILPDNPAFDINDAHDWYRRLGIYDSGLVSLADMKLAIAQKLSFPLVPLNKQNFLYVQQQLQAAGFDVYVYENRFLVGGVYVTQNPGQVIGTNPGSAAVSGFFQSGQDQYGQANTTTNNISVIANYIEDAKDAGFNFGTNLRSTFYIGGSTIGTFATVPEVRHNEFRQLILKLKPLQAVGFLMINYI